MLVHLKPTTKQSHIPFLHLFFLHLQETNSSTNSGAGFCLSHSTASASSFLSNHALLGLDDCCFPVHVSTHSFGNLPFSCEYIEHPVLEAAWNQHLQQAKKDAFTADGNIMFSSHVKKMALFCSSKNWLRIHWACQWPTQGTNAGEYVPP